MVSMVSIGLYVILISNVRAPAILLLLFIGSQKLRNSSGIQCYDFHIECNHNQSSVFGVEICRQIEGRTNGRTPGQMDRHDLHYISHVHMG
jgi:hypothetical protein